MRWSSTLPASCRSTSSRGRRSSTSSAEGAASSASTALPTPSTNGPEYGALIGGYFDNHPWRQEVEIRVEDRDHAATRHLGASFRISDEIYQFKNWERARVDVLLSLDTDSVDAQKQGVKRTDGDFALAWTRDYGDGRMFYTALGHEDAVWQDERFQRLVVNGIVWAMGGPRQAGRG